MRIFWSIFAFYFQIITQNILRNFKVQVVKSCSQGIHAIEVQSPLFRLCVLASTRIRTRKDEN